MVLSHPEIELQLQAYDTGIGLDITETEVGVPAVFDLGDTTLAAPQPGGQLGLGETRGHPGDDELVDQPGLDRKPANCLGHPTVTVPAEHFIDVTIGSPSGDGSTGNGFERSHGQELRE